MATAKNKLPTFGANASVDSSIVNGTSELANSGFQANTIIRSAQVNTYLKVLMNNINGLIDAIYNEGASQGEISATSSSDDVKNYITAGLSKIIAGTKVNNAIHADEATNVDSISNTDTADNANVKFSIGDQSYSKTVNNVSHASNADNATNATNATNVSITDNGSTDDTIKFKIGTGTYEKTVNNVANASACSGNAASATKLETARKISLTGDASGEVNFDGTADAAITVDVAKSAALDSVNVGDTTHPVYFNDAGKPAKCNDTIANNISGKAASADKLNTNAGDTNTPVYFSNGVPVVITGLDKSLKLIFTTTPGLQQNPTFDDIFYFNTMATDYAPIAQRAAKLTLSNSGIGGIVTYADANVGDINTPVYFDGGIPKECTTYRWTIGYMQNSTSAERQLTVPANSSYIMINKTLTSISGGEYSESQRSVYADAGNIIIYIARRTIS